MNGLFSAETLRRQKQMRWNPLRNLTPETLVRSIEAFDYGDLREFALLAEAVAERDDTIKSVKPKREKEIAQLPWQVLTTDESPEALAQKAVLEDFYNHVTAVNAFDRNERGGFSRMVRQMMTSVSYKYAVHHIVWHPSAGRFLKFDDGRQVPSALSATFEFVPLNFFENRTGTLRFIPDGLGIEGQEMGEHEWMVTTGDGLMVAVVTGFFMKRLCVNDWLNFSEKFGLPGVMGRTSAAKESDAGEAMRSAVESFGNDWAAVIYGDDGNSKIELVTASGGSASSLPFPPLIERIDRKFAALYRGADLSTMSSKEGEGSGASLQKEESDILKLDDAQTISEALNYYVDRQVLAYHFGAGVERLAYIKLMVPEDEDADKALGRMERLADRGAKISLAGAMERCGVPPAADEDDELLQSRSQAPDEDGSSTGKKPTSKKKVGKAVNSRTKPLRGIDAYMKQSEALLGDAFGKAMAPTRDAILRVLNSPDEGFDQAVNNLAPELLRIARAAGADRVLSAAFAKVLSGALFNGLTESK